MPERMIEGNGVTLWTESFGDAGGVPLLLIMGATARASTGPMSSSIRGFTPTGRIGESHSKRTV